MPASRCRAVRRRPLPARIAPPLRISRSPMPASPARRTRSRPPPQQGGFVARVGIEMVEHLVEEGLDHPLGAGAAHRGRGVPRRRRHCRRRVGPGGGASSRGAGAAQNVPARPAEFQPPGAEDGGEIGVERGQAAQAPYGQLRHDHRFQCPWRHEGQRRGVDLPGQRDVESWRRRGVERDSRAGSRGARERQQQEQETEASHRRRDRFPTCPPRYEGRDGRPCMSWNTRPPVTGLASASRTSTSCARR